MPEIPEYIMEWIADEVESATKKHPLWPHDLIHAAAIVGEESGELIQATVQCVYENGGENHCRVEAIHTAATCIRFLIGLEKNHYTKNKTY